MIPALTEAPPGLETREIPARPDVDWLLAGEEGEDDIIDPAFFRKMDRSAVVEHTWEGWPYPPNRFPMAYTNVAMISATFTLPLEEAEALVPESERLSLLRVTPRRSAITFFAFDYRRGGLGVYRELGVAVPVILDSAAPPILPALLERFAPARYPGLGNYAVELPVNSDRACEAGIRLYGLPKTVGEAHFAIHGASGTASLKENGKRMAELKVELDEPGEVKRLNFPLRTVSVLDGKLIETPYEVLAEGHLVRKGSAHFDVGSHPRFAKFKDLSLSDKPVELRVIPRLNWIIWGPRDRGSL